MWRRGGRGRGGGERLSREGRRRRQVKGMREGLGLRDEGRGKGVGYSQ